MSINLNHSQYGAQFKAFAEFASAHKNQDWVVRIEGQGRQQGGQGLLGPNGEYRRIVAKTLDGAGNILRFSGSRAVNNDVRSLFKETVLAVCGVKRMEDLPPSVLAVMKAGDYDGKGHPLTVRRIKAVTSAIRALEGGPIPITGKAANDISKIVLKGSGMEDKENPGPELKNRMARCATADVQTLVVNGTAYLKGQDGSLDLDKYTDTFEADVKRGLHISFNDGPSVSSLGAAKARDAYVDFLTNGEVKTYAEADDRTRIKANALMMLTTQGIGGCAIKSVGNAFDANGNLTRLSPGSMQGVGVGRRIDHINVTKDDDGNIHVEADIMFIEPRLVLIDDRGNNALYECDKDSFAAFNLKVTINADSLDDFADADWKTYNHAEIQKIENDITHPHCIEAAADALPDAMKLDIAVDVSFSVHADSIM